MAPRVQVHVSLTRDIRAVMNAARKLRPQGLCDVLNALKIAQLTLKNRQNKNQRQRIVLFIGSELTGTKEELVAMGKKLRKNNIDVDVVLFGEEVLTSESNVTDTVREFIAAVDVDGSSRLVIVPIDAPRFSDDVLISPLGRDVNASLPHSAITRQKQLAGIPAASTTTTTTSTVIEEPSSYAGQVPIIASNLPGVDPEYLQTLAQIIEYQQTDPELAEVLKMSLNDSYPQYAHLPQSAFYEGSTHFQTQDKEQENEQVQSQDDDLAEAIRMSMALQEDTNTEMTDTNDQTEASEQKKEDKSKTDENEDADDFMKSLLNKDS